MTIKTKIALALTFLFVVLLALGGLSSYYLNRLSRDSEAILKDNYISLEYVSTMQKALTHYQDPASLRAFEAALTKQETNITEQGEATATANLRALFDRYRRGGSDSLTRAQMQQALFTIADLNRQATVRKSETAKESAREALQWLSVVGGLCFLVLFSFIINFPGYIANPLHELTRGIKQIASRNFEERLHVRSSDEFGELARSFNSMAQKLDEYEHSNLARVLFEKKRIETLIQSMSEGIVGLDEQNRILFANATACRLLGTDEADLLGRYAPDVAAHNDLLRTLIQDVIPQTPGQTANGKLSNVPNGTGSDLLKIYDPLPANVPGEGGGKESYFRKRTHRVEVTRTGEEQPQRAGYVIVLENVTTFKELDLAKTNFIATVSHELKTPLASIKMSLKLLDDSRIGTLNTEQTELVGHVRADADRLLNLTSELLNMAQVESGQIQLSMHPTRPADIVRYAVDGLRLQAEQKRITLNIDLAPTLPAVQADPDKASWVLVNFLSNAIRHSPDDSTIDITATTTPDGKAVEFRVRDYGAGIRPEHQARVFDRYFKAPGRHGQASGTGLGLAISSEFIQSMNGLIGLDTSVSPGAAFYFRLPIAGGNP
jgi:two-component system, NtrC family, sensor histidine kinase KinB